MSRRYPAPVTVTEKRRAKHRLIVETAAGLFSSRGYHATRMQDIAEALDMQAGSLYYYFDSKESLLTAIVEQSVGIAVERLEAIIDEHDDALTRVRRGITAHLTIFDEHADLYSIFNSEKLDTISPTLAQQVDELGRRYEELWVQILEEGIRTRAIRPDLDPTITMKGIIGLCNSALFWFTPDGALSATDLATRFADLMLRGIAVDSSF